MTMNADLRYRVIDFLEELDTFLDEYVSLDYKEDDSDRPAILQTEAQELREALEELE